jgi:HK97 family phage major capsid protein
MTGAPPEDAIFRPRALIVSGRDAPDGKVSLPALRWGAGGVYGNITFVQAAYEGTPGQSDDPKYDGIMMEPQRTSAFFTIGNSLLRNVPAMNTIIERIFRNAKSAWEENLFLQGPGLTGPLGALNAPCAIRVPRQTANAIHYADVVAMFIESYGSPVWVANMSALPQIVTLSDDTGKSIFNAEGPVQTLLSRPIFWTRRLPKLGNPGDLLLVDPAFYCIADGSLFITASQAPFFTLDLTLVKLTFYIDGQPWLRAPLTLEDGTSASPFVALQ